jgi:hypothetical protein
MTKSLGDNDNTEEVASSWKVEVAMKVTLHFSDLEKPLTADQVIKRVMKGKFPEAHDFKEEVGGISYVLSTTPGD